MALKHTAPTPSGVDATYWRIETIELEPTRDRGRIVVGGHADEASAQSATTPLRTVYYSFGPSEYADYVDRIGGTTDPIAPAYAAVKARGAPDTARDVDLSQATDV